MKLTKEEKEQLEQLYQSLLNHELVKRMIDIPMHRGSNCYYHSFKVTKLAIKRGLRHKNVNLHTILLAGIFHDYYLYDWRKDKTKRKHHGSHHPYLAAKLAKEDFSIDESVQKVIKSHMWPINIKEFPRTKEARILTLADKAIATKEALTSKRYKSKRKEKYENYIKTLFDY